jgi:hypothetical protein
MDTSVPGDLSCGSSRTLRAMYLTCNAFAVLDVMRDAMCGRCAMMQFESSRRHSRWIGVLPVGPWVVC